MAIRPAATPTARCGPGADRAGRWSLMETYRNTNANAEPRQRDHADLHRKGRPQGAERAYLGAARRLKSNSSRLPRRPRPRPVKPARLRQLREHGPPLHRSRVLGPGQLAVRAAAAGPAGAPLQRPEAGLTDGAVFVLANGTNPEVLLLIEALAAAVRIARAVAIRPGPPGQRRIARQPGRQGSLEAGSHPGSRRPPHRSLLAVHHSRFCGSVKALIQIRWVSEGLLKRGRPQQARLRCGLVWQQKLGRPARGW